MVKRNNKTNEALLVIVTGFLVLFLVFDKTYLLYVSVVVGSIGVFIKPLADIIARAWFNLGDILGFVVSKIVLGIMFFFLLVPIALLHNLFNKNPMKLKHLGETQWVTRGHKYVGSDFKNIW
ncbi:MAG TPA: SxtJ family membrane protein [Prolixibacteraceae bacterium]|nr:SxtJ family membrane protein [Prolixibacteraceae bacterium]